MLSRAELDSLEISHWRELMDSVRALLFNMRDNGLVEILQKGNVLNPATTTPGTIRGPIRARLIQSNDKES